MRLLIISILALTFINCSPVESKKQTDKDDCFLNETLYDSVQNLVKSADEYNFNSKFYLLQVIRLNKDTIELYLKTINNKGIVDGHLNNRYWYNIDSSILIFDSGMELLFSKYHCGNRFSNDQIAMLTTNVNSKTFNPTVWQIYILRNTNEVLVNRNFGENYMENQRETIFFNPH